MRMQPLKNEKLTPEMEQIKAMIAQTFLQRNAYKSEMEEWYQKNPRQHYPHMNDLILTDATLSQLDSCYKQLWDYHNAK